MADTTVTKYAVARKEKLVGALHDAPSSAIAEHASVSATMESVGLEPDVRVVEVDVTTSISRPRAYREPSTDNEGTDDTEETTGETTADAEARTGVTP